MIYFRQKESGHKFGKSVMKEGSTLRANKLAYTWIILNKNAGIKLL